MSGLPPSVSFDRAADYYDATRDVGDEATTRTLDILAEHVFGRGRVLEIGVGTGILALPLAARGIDVVGVDVSWAMLTKLREKTRDGVRLQVLRTDATHLPFPDGCFGAAYARHVLHLIPRWPTAVAELCRVVGQGVVLVDAGIVSPEWQEVWREISPVLGPASERVGLDVARDGEAALDDAFGAAGARPGRVVDFAYEQTETMADVIDEMQRRSPSWTWDVPDDALRDAIEIVRRWTLERHGRLDARLAERNFVRWHTYRIDAG
ncbi:MAG: class I SAM-dependent methyltransferase [Actinomycetota bacterium]